VARNDGMAKSKDPRNIDDWLRGLPLVIGYGTILDQLSFRETLKKE
jgi:hypothetical protein